MCRVLHRIFWVLHKNHLLFNKNIWKNPKIYIRDFMVIRDSRVILQIKIIWNFVFNKSKFFNKNFQICKLKTLEIVCDIVRHHKTHRSGWFEVYVFVVSLEFNFSRYIFVHTFRFYLSMIIGDYQNFHR